MDSRLRVREQVLSRRISVRSNRFPGSRDRSKSSHVLKNVRSSVRPGLHYPWVSVPWQGMTSVKNRDPLRWDEVSSHSASRDGLVSSVTISRGAWLVHRSHARLELSLFLVLRWIARDENVGIRENRDSSNSERGKGQWPSINLFPTRGGGPREESYDLARNNRSASRADLKIILARFDLHGAGLRAMPR